MEKNIPKKTTDRKKILRNAEINSTKAVTVIPFNSNAAKAINLQARNSSSDNKFMNPQRNTTNIIANKIEMIENKDPKSFLTPTDSDMQLINRKASQKFNMHFDEKIYKDLVALNINNEYDTRPKRQIANKKIGSNKDIEPNLEDFYNDVRECDKSIMVSAVKIKLSPMVHYNATDLYEKMKWDT